jgi:hypothetical protein
MRRQDERALSVLLGEAARDAEFPATPQVAGRVRNRIEAGPIPVGTIHVPRTRPPVLRPVIAAAVVLILALALTLSLSVSARRAVADLLGVVGIRVTFGDEPPAAPRPLRDIPLGASVARSEAGERVGFHVMVPRAVPGEPAFYVEPSIGESGMVSVVYPRDARTMAGVDLLVTQFVASVREEYVKKLATLGSEIRYVRVRSSDAYWIGGDPHFVFYEDRDGVRQEEVRLAGNVLLWEEDGVTYRIEGAGSLREARRLAASLR